MKRKWGPRVSCTEILFMLSVYFIGTLTLLYGPLTPNALRTATCERRGGNSTSITLPDSCSLGAHVRDEENASNSNIVFAAQPFDSHVGSLYGHHSRWFGSAFGLSIYIEGLNDSYFLHDHRIYLETQVGYRIRGRAQKFFSPIHVNRSFWCVRQKAFDTPYHVCVMNYPFEIDLRIWDIGTVNIRIPAKQLSLSSMPDIHFSATYDIDGKVSEENGTVTLARIREARIIEYVPDSDFAFFWIRLKSIFFPLTLFCLIWYCKQLCDLPRGLCFHEKATLALGISLTFFDCPVEWLSLRYTRLPYWLIAQTREGALTVLLFTLAPLFTARGYFKSTKSMKPFCLHVSYMGFVAAAAVTWSLYKRLPHTSVEYFESETYGCACLFLWVSVLLVYFHLSSMSKRRRMCERYRFYWLIYLGYLSSTAMSMFMEEMYAGRTSPTDRLSTKNASCTFEAVLHAISFSLSHAAIFMQFNLFGTKPKYPPIKSIKITPILDITIDLEKLFGEQQLKELLDAESEITKKQ